MPLRCAIEAPDAFAAFVLAHELDPVGDHARVEPFGRGYRVAIVADQEELPHTLRVVQRWLEEERIPETVVRYGGRAQLLRVA